MSDAKTDTVARNREPTSGSRPGDLLRLCARPPQRDLLLLGVILLAVPMVVPGYVANDIVAKAMIFGLLAVALDLAWGYGGILSLGHSAFFGTGAYVMGIVLARSESPMAPLVGVLAGIGVPALLGLLVGWFLFYGRTSVLYVAVVTLSLPILLSQLALRIPEWTGGLNGLTVPPFTWGYTQTYFLVFAVLVVGVALVLRIVSSDFGRVLIAVRDNEQRTTFLGYGTPSIRLIVFTLSAAIAGAAGVLYAPYNGFVSFDLLGFVLSTSAIVWVTVGGRGTLVGALLGALLINVLEPLLSAAFVDYWRILIGALFVVLILLAPRGLYGLLVKAGSQAQRFVVERAPARPRAPEPVRLVTERLEVAFGSLRVLDGVDLEVTSGTLHCMIGPNGAGKSTFVNAVTGLVRPTSGHVLLNGVHVEHKRAHVIARAGVRRTFQAGDVFDTLTVGDNLILAAGYRTPSMLHRSHRITLPEHAAPVLDASGLSQKLDVDAGALGHGERKWLELCMVLAAAPKLVFLDEPTAGLSKADRVEVGAVLRELVATSDVGFLLIEHDLEFVTAIADRMTVLAEGKIVADGTVADVTSNELVRAIY